MNIKTWVGKDPINEIERKNLIISQSHWVIIACKTSTKFTSYNYHKK